MRTISENFKEKVYIDLLLACRDLVLAMMKLLAKESAVTKGQEVTEMTKLEEDTTKRLQMCFECVEKWLIKCTFVDCQGVTLRDDLEVIIY